MLGMKRGYNYTQRLKIKSRECYEDALCKKKKKKKLNGCEMIPTVQKT